MKDSYTLDEDLEVNYTLPPSIQPGLGDRVCLYKLPHLQPHEHVAHVWIEASEEKKQAVKFPVSALPQEEAFFQLQYLMGSNNQVAGASDPFQLRRSEKSQLKVLIKDKLQLEQTLAQKTETLGRTENDLNTTREELVNAEQCLKEKEYKIFELKNKLENSREVAINENIKLLNRERDSLKSELDDRAKERDSLKSELDGEIIARESLRKEKQELEASHARESSRKRKAALMILCSVLILLLTINVNFQLLTRERDTLKGQMENLLKEKRDLTRELGKLMVEELTKTDGAESELIVQLYRLTGTLGTGHHL